MPDLRQIMEVLSVRRNDKNINFGSDPVDVSATKIYFNETRLSYGF